MRCVLVGSPAAWWRNTVGQAHCLLYSTLSVSKLEKQEASSVFIFYVHSKMQFES